MSIGLFSKWGNGTIPSRVDSRAGYYYGAGAQRPFWQGETSRESIIKKMKRTLPALSPLRTYHNVPIASANHIPWPTGWR